MKKQIVLALALAAAPLAASAAAPSYNYVEVAAVRMNFDFDYVADSDVDFDGAQLRGSVQVSDPVYLFGGYGKVRNDDAGVDIDFVEAQLGVGFRAPVGQADFIAELGLLRQEIEVRDFGSEHATGGRVSAGFRGQSGELLEGWIKASYTTGGDFDGTFSGQLGAQVRFNPTWGLVGEVEVGEFDGEDFDLDAVKYLVGVRASF